MLGDICDQPTPDDSEDEDENLDEFLPFNVGFIDKNTLAGTNSCKNFFSFLKPYILTKNTQRFGSWM
jgi:hypothetical protein